MLCTAMSDMELIPLLCLLSLWAGCTSAQEIRPGPGVVNVPEGDNARLDCAQASGQSIDEFDWRKDNGNENKKEVFMYNRGTIYSKDHQGQDDQFKGRVEFFQHELKSGNASILIKNTRLEDNGTYTCGLGLDMYNRQEVHIRLNVGGVLKMRINVTGAARVPHIKPIHHEITWSLLECKVVGVPEPEVEWRNSAKEVLAKHDPKSENGHAHVELNLKVTKSDNYTCVATQRDIFHQINNTLEVSIPDVVAVVEGDDAILPCYSNSKQDIKDMKFSWRKGLKEVFSYNKGRVEDDEQLTGRLTHFQQELNSGNASIKIYNTQKSDSGLYSCNLPDIQKSSHTILQIVGKKSVPEYHTALFVGLGIIIGLLCAVGLYFLKHRLRGKGDVNNYEHPNGPADSQKD